MPSPPLCRLLSEHVLRGQLWKLEALPGFKEERGKFHGILGHQCCCYLKIQCPGLVGDARESTFISHPCFSGITHQWLLGCWASSSLNLSKWYFLFLCGLYLFKMRNFSALLLFLDEETLLRTSCADSFFSVLICWLKLTWAFVYSSSAE